MARSFSGQKCRQVHSMHTTLRTFHAPETIVPFIAAVERGKPTPHLRLHILAASKTCIGETRDIYSNHLRKENAGQKSSQGKTRTPEHECPKTPSGLEYLDSPNKNAALVPLPKFTRPQRPTRQTSDSGSPTPVSLRTPPPRSVPRLAGKPQPFPTSKKKPSMQLTQPARNQDT